MKNLQIGLDDKIVSYLDRIATEQHKTRTAVIRDALEYWIKQRAAERFEADWIAAVKADQALYPDDTELWMAAEAWDEE
jgi:predicted transcriptional regulator